MSRPAASKTWLSFSARRSSWRRAAERADLMEEYTDAISRGRRSGGGEAEADDAMRCQYLLKMASMARPRRSAKACGRRSRSSPRGRRLRVSASRTGLDWRGSVWSGRRSGTTHNWLVNFQAHFWKIRRQTPIARGQDIRMCSGVSGGGRGVRPRQHGQEPAEGASDPDRGPTGSPPTWNW